MTPCPHPPLKRRPARMAEFDCQPVLAGLSFALRPLVENDFPSLRSIASDTLVWEQASLDFFRNQSEFQHFLDDALASRSTLVAIDRVSGAVIGSSRYDSSRTEANEIEIGKTLLARSHWSGTANAAIKQLMIGHALRRFDRTIFYVAEDDERACKAMNKIGGKPKGRAFAPQGGKWLVGHVVYEIDRQNFSEGPLSRLAV
jgi:N-acetyltransferase